MTEASTQTLPVRNPRTGSTEFSVSVSTPAEVQDKATRLRSNQAAWAARSLQERIGVMRRWLGEVAKLAGQIGESDAVDTGGCLTSYAQGFITMANIGGWIEDAEEALGRVHFQGRSKVMADVEVETQSSRIRSWVSSVRGMRL